MRNKKGSKKPFLGLFSRLQPLYSIRQSISLLRPTSGLFATTMLPNYKRSNRAIACRHFENPHEGERIASLLIGVRQSWLSNTEIIWYVPTTEQTSTTLQASAQEKKEARSSVITCACSARGSRVHRKSSALASAVGNNSDLIIRFSLIRFLYF